MNRTHHRIGLTVNTKDLKEQLSRQPELWDKYNMRREHPESPHREMVDIWIRANKMPEDGDFSDFSGEHDSVWYEAYEQLPACKEIIFDVMAAVNSERLGGVLITKLPPGGVIYPHADAGWHAAYYDKYYVPIKNYTGSIFGFEDGTIEPIDGDVYYFENDKMHWVRNNSKQDRIAMIICIKRSPDAS